jgi:hypothetical protein
MKVRSMNRGKTLGFLFVSAHGGFKADVVRDFAKSVPSTASDVSARPVTLAEMTQNQAEIALE